MKINHLIHGTGSTDLVEILISITGVVERMIIMTCRCPHIWLPGHWEGRGRRSMTTSTHLSLKTTHLHMVTNGQPSLNVKDMRHADLPCGQKGQVNYIPEAV